MSQPPDQAAPLPPEQVRHLARLAQLRLSDEQVAACGRDLAAILAYVDRLRSLDLRSVEPMVHAGEPHTRLDEDLPGAMLPAVVLMKMAPETMPPFVKVPRVLEDGGGA